jgi:hypothetical protein
VSGVVAEADASEGNGMLANEVRNQMLRQQLGSGDLKRIVGLNGWVDREHTQYSDENKEAMALLLLLCER